MSEYQRWEARFKEPGYHFGTEPNAFLKGKAALFKPGQKVLSIADGEGRNGVFLAGFGCDVLAIDFSPSAAGELSRGRPGRRCKSASSIRFFRRSKSKHSKGHVRTTQRVAILCDPNTIQPICLSKFEHERGVNLKHISAAVKGTVPYRNRD